ncbi:MAG TPA: dephospho-CoA kinase [Terriglobales bacterium]|nr:dephospho-CoA kinase [Terriglobales bacterium]
MLRVGLTGGLACGKTTVALMLASHGAHVNYADQIARDLMQPGQAVYAEVVKHFGVDIVEPDGSINRRKLAEKAFGGGRVQELNQLVHPAVIDRETEWMDSFAADDPDAIVVIEAALILEAGVQDRFNKIVVVTCTPEQRVHRFAARAKLSLEEARFEAERRMAAQIPDEEKVKAADFVIENAGTLAELERETEQLFASLRAFEAQCRV